MNDTCVKECASCKSCSECFKYEGILRVLLREAEKLIDNTHSRAKALEWKRSMHQHIDRK